MSSWIKAGKKLVDEFKPMIAPNRDNIQQYQSQHPYGSPAQPYQTPSTTLSPYFQAPPQASSSTNLHAHTPQYQSPPPQSQVPGSYFSPQPLQAQPHQQPQYPYGAAQSPHVQQQWSQQVQQVQQNTPPNQYFQPPPQQQYQQPQPQPPQQQPQAQQYAPAQTQQYQPAQVQNSYQPPLQQYQPQATSPPPQSYTPSQAPGNLYPQQQPQQQPPQQHDQNVQQHLNTPQNNNLQSLNPPPSPAVSPPSPAPPQQTWSPPVNNTSPWQPPTARATSEAPSAIPEPSAVELPGVEITAHSVEQPHQGSSRSSDGATSLANPTTNVSAPSELPVVQPQPQFPSNNIPQQDWTAGPSHTPQPQALATHPTSFVTSPPPQPQVLSPNPTPQPQGLAPSPTPQPQGLTMNQTLPQAFATNPNPQPYGLATTPTPQPQGLAMSPPPQPAGSTQYFPYPPSTQSTPFQPASPQQQMPTPIMSFPPPPSFAAPSQQSLMPWQQQPPQQEQQMQLPQYQSLASPAPSSLYQPSMQDNQMMALQQGMASLSVVPAAPSAPAGPAALSPRFKVVARPVAIPPPARKNTRNEGGPSVLRVQTDGRGSALRKILCLDGGGVRGLASLMIVKHLMDRLEQQRGGRLEPWQEFDMIAGTSTGGLIAIMLGRLKMTVSQAIDAYKTLSQSIFTPVHSRGNIAGRALTTLRAEGKFDSEPLEQAVKEMCRKHGLSEAELFKDDSEDSPRVFVCAAQGINADSVVIRTYRSGDGEWDDLYDICKIWEAARATSAASTFFPPIQIGYQKYVDGALRYNNPIEKADQESRALWPNEERLIVSVGTGAAPGPNVLASNIADLAKTLAQLVTDTEEENERFRRRNREMVKDNLLFRFNVLQGLQSVKLDEWEAFGEIWAHTSTYMKASDTAIIFNTCANMMKESGQRLGYIAGEDLQAYNKFQAMSAIYAEFCEDCHKGIPYLEKMFFCIDCQLFTCEDCHDSHEQSHLRNMLRFIVMQWMEKLPAGIEPSATCRHCAKDAKSRWECQDCNMALCRTCAGHHDRRIEFFKEHRDAWPDHRSFLATYPPYWSTESEWITANCQCVEIGCHGGHCDRCHKVITRGQRGYDCRTCRTVFGSSQGLCVECFEKDEEHHDQHQFGTYEVVYEDSGPETIKDALKKMWGCSQCSERIAESKYQSHPHLHLRLIITPLLEELFRRLSYQQCRRKEITEDATEVVNPVPFQCSLCTKHLAFDRGGSICLKTDCTELFCADCTLANRQGHRHQLYELAMMRSVKNYLNQVTCYYCQQPYMLAIAQGLWCPDCKNHFMCISCLGNISKGDNPKIQDGLPHTKILKPCKVKTGWQMYWMDGT